MLRPCVFTDEISQDLEHALDVAAQFGVRAVELRRVWGRSIVALADDDIEKIRGILAARGFSVASIASGFFKCDLPGFPAGEPGHEASAAAGRHPATKPALYPPAAGPEAIVQQHIADLRRAVELCRMLDAPLIRGFAFWRPVREPAGLARDPAGPTNRHLRQADIPEPIWRRMVAEYAEPARIVEAASVILGLENEHACGVARGDEAARFVADVGSPNVRVTWEPGNSFFSGEVPYPDGYERVRGQIAHVHVKDAIVDPVSGEARWCVVGAGEIDWAGQFRALLADGYDGAVSLETHYTPAGGTREEGTLLCLPAMMKMLRQAGWRA